MRYHQVFLVVSLFLADTAPAADRLTPKPHKTSNHKNQPKKSPPTRVADPSKDNTPKADQANTIIEIDDRSADDPETMSAKPIDRLFRNPVLVSGLSSGADAINQSIETLMESIFYGLLDNKLKWPLTGSADVNMGLTRDVYTARSGAYVVVDRLGLGPGFSRELYRYNEIPVLLGAQQSTDVYDIYLRSDPMRVHENKSLPLWRVALNNWFGILPILEAVLPPSFNANEMYDPLRRVESPFTFPLSIDSVKSMDIGAIKSYSISGGVNLGVEMTQGIHGFKDQILTGPTALDAKLPVTVFRTGEYRINILKKDANTVWVGMTDGSRLGQRVETKLGKTYYLLSKTIPLWRGMPAPIFPIDFAIEEAVSDLMGRVYAFDLRNDEAKTAYLEAVHGNFAPAQVSWLRSREDKLETGVRYFYTKKETRNETAVATGHNIFLTSRRTKRTHSDAEIEITDASGRYFILEAKQDVDSGRWNMLTGRSEEKISLQADFMVRKVIEKEDGDGNPKSRFEFVADANPIDVSFSIAINDKFVETEELAAYLDELSRFTQLELSDLPTFKTREPELLARRRQRVFLSYDQKNTPIIHVTPTHLGRFEGYGSVKITNAQLLAIATRPRIELWQAFCEAFNISDKEQCLTWEKSLFWRNAYRATSVLSKPLVLIDIKWPAADAVDEIEGAISALKMFWKEKTPEGKQNALRSFFTTDYPIQRIRGLLLLSNLSEIPRSVELETQPKGNAPDDVKNRFKKIDGRRFIGEKNFPPPARYDSTKDTEAKFNPSNLTFAGVRPRLKKISLYREDTAVPRRSPKPTATPNSAPILASRIAVTKFGSTNHVLVYAKLEQSGKIQLAKLKLFEDVVEIPLANEESIAAPDRVNLVLRLSGSQSLLANLVSEESLASGGDFKLTLAVSGNGIIWSEEKTLEFRLENGRLMAR
jgi:hypothetical protein